jgi:hypothetical protein
VQWRRDKAPWRETLDTPVAQPSAHLSNTDAEHCLSAPKTKVTQGFLLIASPSCTTMVCALFVFIRTRECIGHKFNLDNAARPFGSAMPGEWIGTFEKRNSAKWLTVTTHSEHWWSRNENKAFINFELLFFFNRIINWPSCLRMRRDSSFVKRVTTW